MTVVTPEPVRGRTRERARREWGQAVTEYILIIGLVVIPIAIVFNKLQDQLRGLLSRIAGYFVGPGI